MFKKGLIAAGIHAAVITGCVLSVLQWYKETDRLLATLSIYHPFGC